MKNTFCGSIFTTFCICLAHNGRCSLLAEGLSVTFADEKKRPQPWVKNGEIEHARG